MTIISGFVIENPMIGTPTHKAAAACCTSSIKTYTSPTFIDSDKVKIKKPK